MSKFMEDFNEDGGAKVLAWIVLIVLGAASTLTVIAIGKLIIWWLR